MSPETISRGRSGRRTCEGCRWSGRSRGRARRLARSISCGSLGGGGSGRGEDVAVRAGWPAARRRCRSRTFQPPSCTSRWWNQHSSTRFVSSLPPWFARCRTWWTCVNTRPPHPGKRQPWSRARTARRVAAGMAGAFLPVHSTFAVFVAHDAHDRRIACEPPRGLRRERGPAVELAHALGVAGEHLGVDVDVDLESVLPVTFRGSRARGASRPSDQGIDIRSGGVGRSRGTASAPGSVSAGFGLGSGGTCSPCVGDARRGQSRPSRGWHAERSFERSVVVPVVAHMTTRAARSWPGVSRRRVGRSIRRAPRSRPTRGRVRRRSR